MIGCRLKTTIHSASMDREVDQMKLKQLLTATVVSLCNNSLSYSGELTIQGLLGITIDHKDILLVNINETLGHAGSTSAGQQCHTQAEYAESSSMQPVATEVQQNYTSDNNIVAVRQQQASPHYGKSTPAAKNTNRVSKCMNGTDSTILKVYFHKLVIDY